MKYLSLFSGIGGFELGIQKAYENSRMEHSPRQVDSVSSRQEEVNGAGMGDSHAAGQSVRTNEDEPTCIGYSEIDKYATQIYQKHFPNHKNYGDVTKINPEDLPDFDLLVGGFPCQAFSIAGKRGGFADTRGTLFFDIARILKVKRPRLLLLENVKGLLSHDAGRTFKTIISTLAELGYGVEWQVLNAKDFGVPQNRERVFIVGYFGGLPGRTVFPIGSNDTKTSVGIKRIAHMPGFRRYHQTYDTSGIVESLDTSGGGGHQPCVTSTLRASDYKNGDTQTAVVEYGMKIRRLTPLECERLMGLPDNWTAEGSKGKISDTQRYKCCGNGVVSNVVEAVLASLLSKKK